MNWEMLAAFGQLAAVVIGIPSLIYLALQIRAQTQERRQSAVNELTARWGDAMSAFHESREFSAIYVRGIQSFEDLDAVSKTQFSVFFNRNFKNFQAIYFAHRHGMLPDPLWREVERTMTDLIAYLGPQQRWQTRRHWYTEEFAGVVDAMIARGINPTAYSTYV
jgi:hypothetical protein